MLEDVACSLGDPSPARLALVASQLTVVKARGDPLSGALCGVEDPPGSYMGRGRSREGKEGLGALHWDTAGLLQTRTRWAGTRLC